MAQNDSLETAKEIDENDLLDRTHLHHNHHAVGSEEEEDDHMPPARPSFITNREYVPSLIVFAIFAVLVSYIFLGSEISTVNFGWDFPNWNLLLRAIRDHLKG